MAAKLDIVPAVDRVTAERKAEMIAILRAVEADIEAGEIEGLLVVGEGVNGRNYSSYTTHTDRYARAGRLSALAHQILFADQV